MNLTGRHHRLDAIHADYRVHRLEEEPRAQDDAD